MKKSSKDQLRQKETSELILDLTKKKFNLMELKFKLAQGQLKDTKSPYKLKKEIGLPEIRLEATPDILQAVALSKETTGRPKLAVGFAAESQDLIENARHKLEIKKLDLMVANDITASNAGFESDTNLVTLLYPDGSLEHLPLMSKENVAEVVFERLLQRLGD